jgi:hypothetical protein
VAPLTQRPPYPRASPLAQLSSTAHGSRRATGRPLAATTAPAAPLISAGRANRDYFAAPAGAQARAAVEDAAPDLAAFEQAALATEAPEAPLSQAATVVTEARESGQA